LNCGDIIILDKQLCCESFTASGIVCQKPCWLYSISVSRLLPAHACIIDTDTTPVTKGLYRETGIYNGYPYYYCATTGHYIWISNSLASYNISSILGGFSRYLWYLTYDYPNGYYIASGDCSGNPVVILTLLSDVKLYDGFDISYTCRLFLTGLIDERSELHYKNPVFYSEGLYLYLPIVGLNCLLTYKAA
jgi:hypothetical protein